MQIGHKIYYNKATGIVLLDKGEMQGDVRETTFAEDKLYYPQLAEYTDETIGIIQLAYGERYSEFYNIGSMKVINNELVIYQRLTITADKAEILADGVDSVTIEVVIKDTVNSEDISITVNDGEPITITTVNGVANLSFTTTLTGTYTIKASSDTYGINSIVIEGV